MATFNHDGYLFMTVDKRTFFTAKGQLYEMHGDTFSGPDGLYAAVSKGGTLYTEREIDQIYVLNEDKPDAYSRHVHAQEGDE